LKLEQKKKMVEELRDRFARSKITIITDYKGLNVAAMTDLRSKLRDSNIEYRVVKNTLLTRAAEGTDAALIQNAFQGPSAVALSYEDPVAPARVLTDFAKQNDKFEIKVGVMGGRVLDLSSIKALSSLPSREVLLGQFLCAINGVPTGLVRALSDVPRRLLNVLQAIKQEKEAA
jgi:large subunit ribosomal protein L10